MEKKFLLIFILIVLTSSSFAQEKKDSPTKEETEKWIQSKIHQYSYESLDGSFKYTYNIDFGEIILTIDVYADVPYLNGNYKRMLPIKLIESFSMIEKKENYWLRIYMKNGEELIVATADDGSSSLYSHTEILLSKDIENDNMKDRLLKALYYMLELYTGESIKEPF